MAALTQEFDANTVDPATAFPVYPAGKYLVEIVQSEMRPTKNGDGQFLWLEMSILDGEYTGCKLYDRLNLVNNNQTAQEIAQRTLSAICHAVNVMRVSDSEQLHFKPMVVELRVKPAGPDKSGVQRDAQNEVKGYSSADGSKPATQPAQQGARPAQAATRPAVAQPAKPAPTGTATPPWRR